MCPLSTLQGHKLGTLLRLDYEFRGQQALLLILRHVGAIYDVGDEVAARTEAARVAIDERAALLSTMNRLLPCFLTATSVYLRTSI